MKTNVIEIFQTIRATMQPYEALGFATRINSDSEYELWSEKLAFDDDRKNSPRYFAGLKIFSDYVLVNIGPTDISSDLSGEFTPAQNDLFSGIAKFEVTSLDESLLEEISAALSQGFKIYKQQEWV